ncbi:hypothetical protein ACFLUR_02275 [Chloroflexota bacterium]
MLIPTTGCEPEYHFQVENRTDQTLLIFVNDYQRAELQVGMTSTCYFPGTAGRFFLEARNPNATVIYKAEIPFERFENQDLYIVFVSPP